MLADLRGIQTKQIDADLCIIGAGAAGMTLARAFIGSGVRVCLLESGGFEHEEATQALYDGEDTGYRQLYDVGKSRLRFFGGTTNHWVGHCAPLTEIDFETRPWVPYSGWPINKAALDPYYAPAQALCELGTDSFDLASFSDIRPDLPPFDTAKFSPRVWHLSPPTRFGQRYRDALVNAANIAIYLHANVTELETNRDVSQVVGAGVKTLDGQQTRVVARYFVLACGGIENARILLLSNRSAPRGLGNDHDLVGRFYIDQLRCEEAAFVAAEDNRLFDTMVGGFRKNGLGFEAMLSPSGATQERHETLNWVAEFETMRATSDWALSMYHLKNLLQTGRWPADLGHDIWSVITHLDAVGKDIYQRQTARPLSILARCEVAPDPESRITLTTERDALGQNKVRRHLRVTLREKHTLRSAMRSIGEELGRIGAGRVRLADWLLADNDEWPRPEQQYAGVHHIGTTRMAADPAHGVVDRDCRVHGIANLYVGGSSVFPTAGYAHPTLSIVAMALRLADHLKQRLPR
ncbi:MAG: GMC oxidoreductase [Gammaproteobacteria bacterium]|nr:MAG: GMC oxidoreductase [Gammaproteobacteria bacterium]TND06997.1 MAG: GMC oxidoreductase [Gammaproteobacteria bacterium]